MSKQGDNFGRADSAMGPLSRMMSMGRMSSLLPAEEKAQDPYQLDFTELRKQYVKDTTVQVPFVKSGFVHYSKCPRNMKINGKEYKDLVITMEVIQAPSNLNYTQLEDPQVARRQRQKAFKKQKTLAKQRAKKAQQQGMFPKEMSKAIKIVGLPESSSSESDSEDDSDNEQTDEISVSEVSSEQSGDDSSSSSSSSSSGSNKEDDREYTGDMFGVNKPVKFEAGEFEEVGQLNPTTGTKDYCCISIWSSGGTMMRMVRLKDTIVPVAPLANDQKFRVAHDAKRLYFIGWVDGVKKLILVYLKDLSYKIVDMFGESEHIETLEHSSLFRNYLCYQRATHFEIQIKGKNYRRSSKNFFVYNLVDKDRVWELPECEAVFFLGQDSAALKMVEFQHRDNKERKSSEEESEFEDGEDDGPQLVLQDPSSSADESSDDSDGSDCDSDSSGGYHVGKMEALHKGIMVIKSSYEEGLVGREKKKKGVDEKEKARPAQQEKIMRIYYRTYYPAWRKPVTKKRIFYECYVDLKAGIPVLSKSAKHQENVEEDGDEVDNALLTGHDVDYIEEREVVATSDCQLMILALIVKGSLGEQHRVLLFNPEKQGPLVQANRSGNTDLEFNMNAHIRVFNQIFIVQTEPSGQVTARQINFDPEDSTDTSEKVVPVVFTNPMRGYSKDCWIIKEEDAGEEDWKKVMTICKSANDDYLNSDCILPANKPNLESGEKLLITVRATKIRAQEVEINFPCLISNIGMSRIMIQSVTNPDQVAFFKLGAQSTEEFICFTEYESDNDIGFTDKRDPVSSRMVPFSEAGDKVAFLTRVPHKCSKKSQCKDGDILLNVLVIDQYANPMKYELYRTHYEACMGEGLSDDCIQKCMTMQITTQRGLDVAFIAQYNDRIIYDCITSIKQLPIRFPKPSSKKELELLKAEDPDFQKKDCEWQPMDICNTGQMVRQKMIADADGAIYFMMKTGVDTVRVLRTDPHVEMGDYGFVKTVFSLRSHHVYFLLCFRGLFYMMDETKKIRLLKPDKETHAWKQVNSLELSERDAMSIHYADFDEFSISDGVLHYKDKIFFLLSQRSRQNPTWDSQEFALENHRHVNGPRYAKDSSLIWSIQKYANLIGEEQTDKKAKTGKLGTYDKKGVSFKGYSMVMQPLADTSFMDILPQRGVNNRNFVTWLNDQTIFAIYSGRYLLFNRQGKFLGHVAFENMDNEFRPSEIKLVNVSDSGKFFLFEGPRILTKEERTKQRKAARSNRKSVNINQLEDEEQPQGEKTQEQKQFEQEQRERGTDAPVFYVFKLKHHRLLGKSICKFCPYKTLLHPVNDLKRKKSHLTTQRIDYLGAVSQCTIRVDRSHEKTREIEIDVRCCPSKENFASEEKVQQSRSIFSFGSSEAKSPDFEVTKELYRVTFEAQSRNQKRKVLDGKIQDAKKRLNLGYGTEEDLARFKRRYNQLDRAWVFDNYVVIKCGSELKYIQRGKPLLDIARTNSIDFSLAPGAEVWIESVIATGIKDLVQLFIIDDANRRLFLVTWNLQQNREHSLYQTTYASDVFPESLLMQGHSEHPENNFNFFMDSASIVDLDSNLPVQYFDLENEADTMPKGSLLGLIEGMKRLPADRSRYLDLTKPGRIHHFISFTDLLYWERFQLLKDKHEISQGTMSTFSPIARFPTGVSVFHHFATNVKVLNAVQDAFTIARQERQDDPRVAKLPLMFLHSCPQLNGPGKKYTPIHIALDKQSPIAFETMFELLVDQGKVCVTAQLLDVLEQIINSKSQAVYNFFENSFYVTDQYAGLHALEWADKYTNEMILATPCAYLTTEFLQTFVKRTSTSQRSLTAFKEDAGKNRMSSLLERALGGQIESEDSLNAPLDYSIRVEPVTHTKDQSVIKQVEAKLLDFNWVFIGDNALRLTKTLAHTLNDEVFACAQIRVFVDFMWQGYFNAILQQLFIPFICYFASFLAYTGFFSHGESDELSLIYIGEITCLVIVGKTWLTFLLLELIQLRQKGTVYFWDAWNIFDLVSLGLNFFYVLGEVTNSVDQKDLQVWGAIAVFFMYIKLFYWMRLFKQFSAFIRMIQEILADIRVFLVMLMISLGAFANVIYLLNLNRTRDDSLYAPLLGIPPLDALFHAYLTGLGDFNDANYSRQNAQIVWVMFIFATLIVQIIFMNLLIAIMGESFSRITAITQQSTLKELCGIMEDHIWLLHVDEIHQDKRYILWLTPDTTSSGGTAVERQISQLKEQVTTSTDQQEQRMLRAMNLLSEDVAALKASLDEIVKKAEKGEDSD